MSRPKKDEKEKELRERFGKKLRRLRKEAKLTQQNVGDFVGLTGQQIGRYERGEDNINLPILRKIIEGMGYEWETYNKRMGVWDMFGDDWEDLSSKGKEERRKMVADRVIFKEFIPTVLELSKEFEKVLQTPNPIPEVFYDAIRVAIKQAPTRPIKNEELLRWMHWILRRAGDELDNLAEVKGI